MHSASLLYSSAIGIDDPAESVMWEDFTTPFCVHVYALFLTSCSSAIGNDDPAESVMWEDFTAFWVEAGMVNTHSEAVKCWADESVRYAPDQAFALTNVRRPVRLVSYCLYTCLCT